jgi:hypothetical protein
MTSYILLYLLMMKANVHAFLIREFIWTITSIIAWIHDWSQECQL